MGFPHPFAPGYRQVEGGSRQANTPARYQGQEQPFKKGAKIREQRFFQVVQQGDGPGNTGGNQFGSWHRRPLRSDFIVVSSI